MTTQTIHPLILGTDISAYGLARAFHEATRVKSFVFGNHKLLATSNTSILDVYEFEGFYKDEVMVQALIDFSMANKDKTLVLLAGSENYVYRIFKNYDALKDHFLIPYTAADQGLNLSDKSYFYEQAERYGLSYPKSWRLNLTDYLKPATDISFPLVFKPSESTDYFSMSFEGKEKAYIVRDETELKHAFDLVKQAGYQHDMILQEFVEGPITNEYVMNVYCDSNAKVRLMSLGQIAIEDPQPDMRGNYISIVSVEDSPLISQLYEQVRYFLESINYKGLANFDFKLDDKDGQFKCFEINLRQGRSSYFSILAGANFAETLLADIQGQDIEGIVLGNKDFIWMNCSERTFNDLLAATDPALYQRVKTISNRGNTLYYDRDLSLLRRLKLDHHYRKYDKKIKGQKKLAE